MEKRVYTHEERLALVRTEGVTLDGEVAHIVGARLDYPLIVSATQRVEFSWPTVERIVNKGGAFKS